MVAPKQGGKRVGYIRVSTLVQNTERQLDGIPVDETFTDKLSGKDRNRPQLEACLKYLRAGDVMVVHSIDRLARNVEDLLRTVRELNARGVLVEFVKENLVFAGDTDAMSKLMVTVLGAVAQFERELLLERQREGIAIAQRKGLYKGRKPALSKERVDELHSALASGERKTLVARRFGISRATLYSYIEKGAASP